MSLTVLAESRVKCDVLVFCIAKHTTIAHDLNYFRPFNYGGLKLIDIRENPTLQPKVLFSRFLAHILQVVNAGNDLNRFQREVKSQQDPKVD